MPQDASGFSDLPSKQLGIWTWSMNNKSWQWAWSTLGQNFVKIHALGAELRRFLVRPANKFYRKTPGFFNLASRPLGISTWTMKDKRCPWVLSTLCLNLIKIQPVLSKLHLFLCSQQK